MTNLDKKKLEQNFFERYNKLNNQQQNAVDNIEGPVMVIAGPGTGKTEILSMRIANILLKTDIRAYNILCLTYTEEGALNMKSRLFNIIGTEAYLVNIFTFHSFSNKVIIENPHYFNLDEFNLISNLEQQNLFKEIVEELNFDNVLKPLKGENLYNTINDIRNIIELIQKENYNPIELLNKCDNFINLLPENEKYLYKRNGKNFKKGNPNEKKIQDEIIKINKIKSAIKIFDIYKEKLIAKKLYTYNDMIQKTIECFSKENYVLAKYQERFQYVLIDEYQDTNGSQNEIINKLMNFWDTTNLFVVGDEDQCIYRFQGAEIKNMKDFYEQYKQNIKIITLEKNYRSSPTILTLAQKLISYNKNRLSDFINNNNQQKKLISEGKFKNIKHKPILNIYSNELNEIVSVIEQIKKLNKEEKKDYNEIAILYNKNKTGIEFAKHLKSQNIPYQISKNIDIFKEDLILKVIKIITYITSENENPYNSNSNLFQILNLEYFNNSAKVLANAIIEMKKEENEKFKYSLRYYISKQLELLQNDNPKLYFDGFEELENLINLQHQKNSTDFVINILNKCKILEWINKQEEKIWYIELINSFLDLITLEAKKNTHLTIKDILKNVINVYIKENIEFSITQNISNKNGVILKTCHSAKGKEFDTVFLVNCTNGEWKSRASKLSILNEIILNENVADENNNDEDENLEEKRRLFYVGLTRAKQNLIISYSAKDGNLENAVSNACNFINELTDNNEQNNILEINNLIIDEQILFNYQFSILQNDLNLKEKFVKIIDKDLIDNMLLNFNMSASTLSSFLNCSIAFYYNNILKVPSESNANIVFGNLIHNILETVYKEMLSNNNEFSSEQFVLNEWQKIIEKNKYLFSDYEFATNLEYGKLLLSKIYNQYIINSKKNVLLEYNIRENLTNNIFIKGKLDKIELIDNQAIIIDYKTGNVKKENNNPPNEKNQYGGSHWQQATIYKLLLQLQKKYIVSLQSIKFIHLVYNKSNPKISFEEVEINPSSQDVEFIKKLLIDSYNKIKNYEFDNFCGECEWCKLLKSK